MKKKVLCRRVAAIVLSAAMCLTGLPVDALAAPGAYEAAVSDENESEEDSSEEEMIDEESTEELSEDIDEETIDDFDIEEEIIADEKLEAEGESKAAAGTETRTTCLTISVSTATCQNDSEGWYWDASEKTLYLNNANFNVTGEKYALEIKRSMKINVTGNCSISGKRNGIYIAKNFTDSDLTVDIEGSGRLTVIQSSSSENSTITSAISGEGKPISLNINVPTDLVSNNIYGTVKYLSNVTISKNTNISTNSKNGCGIESVSNLTVNSGAKLLVNVARSGISTTNLDIEAGGNVQVISASDSTLYPAVSATNVTMKGGAALDILATSTTHGLVVKNELDMSEGSSVSVISEGISILAGNLVENTETTGQDVISLCSGATITAGSSQSDAIVVEAGNVNLTDGGTINVTGTGSWGNRALRIDYGNLSVSNDAKINIGSADNYVYGTGIYFEGTYNKVTVKERGRINTYSQTTSAQLNQHTDFEIIEGGIVEFNSNSYSSYDNVISNQYGTITISGTDALETQASILTVNSPQSSAFSDSLKFTVSDNGKLTCNATASFGDGSIFTVKNGGLAEFYVQENNYNSLLQLRGETNINNGTVRVFANVDPSKCYCTQDLYLYSGKIVVSGEDGLLEINSNIDGNCPLYMYSGSLKVLGGTVNVISNGPGVEAEGKSSLDVFLGGRINISADINNYGSDYHAIRGAVDVNVNNGYFNINRTGTGTDDTFSPDCKFNVKNANIVTPSKGKIVNGVLLNETEDAVKGSVSIEPAGVPSMAFTKQPVSSIKGTPDGNLSLSVEVETYGFETVTDDSIVYQWHKVIDGTDTVIPGAVSSEFIIPSDLYGVMEIYCVACNEEADLSETSSSCKATLIPGEGASRKARKETLIITPETPTTSNAEEGWSWDKTNSKLVFDNVFFDVTGSEASYKTVDLSVCPATIEVKGNCSFLNESNDSIFYIHSDNADGKITFIGDGVISIPECGNRDFDFSNSLEFNIPLNVNANSSCFNDSKSDGKLSLVFNKPIYCSAPSNNTIYTYGNVTFNSDFELIASQYCVYSGLGNITLKNAKGTLKGEIYTSSNDSKISIDGSDLYFDSSAGYLSDFIYGYNLDINNSKVEMNGGKDRSIYGVSISSSNSEVNIKDSEVKMYGGNLLYGFYGSYNDFKIENSKIDIESEHGGSYGFYNIRSIDASDSEITVESNYVAISTNVFEAENCEVNITSSSTENSNYLINCSETYLTKGTVLSIDTKGTGNPMYIYNKLSISESTVDINAPKKSSSAYMVYTPNLELIGSILYEAKLLDKPKNAYFDTTEKSFCCPGEEVGTVEYPTEIKIIPDPNPYAILEGITVTSQGKTIEDGVVTRNKDSVLTANYKIENGNISDLEIQWFKADFKQDDEHRFTALSGENKATLTIKPEEVGKYRYKCVISWNGGSSELSKEINLDAVYDGHKKTESNVLYGDSDIYYFEAEKNEDRFDEYGWKWDGESRVLTLSYAYFDCGFVLPSCSTIVLADGTESYLYSRENGINCGESTSSTLDIIGNGKISMDVDYPSYGESGGILNFRDVTLHHGVEMVISIYDVDRYFGINTGNGGSLTLDYAKLTVNDYYGYEGYAVKTGKLVLNDSVYEDGLERFLKVGVTSADYKLYKDSSYTSLCNEIKIVPVNNPMVYFKSLPDTANFMNRGSLSALTAEAGYENMGNDVKVSYEWYSVSDWYGADPVKVSTKNTYTPNDEIGEQLLFVKAIVVSGKEEYTLESDVFAAYVMKEGREVLRKAPNLYEFQNITEEDDYYKKYGILWDYTTKVLTLDNAYIYVDKDYKEETYKASGALYLVNGYTVEVTEGSFNLVRSNSKYDAPLEMTTFSVSASKKLTFAGKGKLLIENVNKEYSKETLFGLYATNGTYVDGMYFKDGIDVTFCGSRTNATKKFLAIKNAIIVDNAKLNLITGNSENTIYVESGANAKKITLQNGAELNIDCFGKAYATYSNWSSESLSVDESSSMNVLCKKSVVPRSYEEYGICLGSADKVNIEGKLNVTVPTGSAITAALIAVGTKGELNCIGTEDTSNAPLINIPASSYANYSAINGKLTAVTNAPVAALSTDGYSFSINAGAEVLLSNNSTSKNVPDEACFTNSAPVNVSGNVSIINVGGGAAIIQKNQDSSKDFTIGTGVTTDPSGATMVGVKSAYNQNIKVMQDGNGNVVSEFRTFSEEPEELTGVTVSGKAAAKKTLSVSELTPATATVFYQWEISDDGVDFEYIGNTGKSFYVDDMYEGLYIRLKATGYGKYKETVYSEVFGPVEPDPSRIISVTVNGKTETVQYWRDSITFELSNLTEKAEISVETYSDKAEVYFDGVNTKSCTLEDLPVGITEVTVKSTVDDMTSYLRINIDRKAPEHFDIHVSRYDDMPIDVSLGVGNETESVEALKGGSAYMNFTEGDLYSVYISGSNAQYGVWALCDSNNNYYYLDKNGKYTEMAVEDKAFSLDVDCVFPKAVVSPAAAWKGDSADTVKVSWSLPGGSMPVALTDKYAYDYVIVNCYDHESDSLVRTVNANPGENFVYFEGLDYTKEYDFVLSYGNSQGKEVLPYGISEYYKNQAEAKVAVGARPAGYELTVLDENGKTVNFAALMLDNENENVKYFTTNLPEDITLNDSNLKISDEDIAEVSLTDDGKIKVVAKKVGSTFLTLTPSIFGKSSAAELRIDVYEADADGKETVPKTTRTSISCNVYASCATADSTLRIYFEGDTTDKITSAEFTDANLNKYFVFEIQDDRTVAVVANPEFDFAAKENAAEIKKIKASVKSGILVKTVKYPEGKETAPITLKITKKLPSVKAGAVKLNSFFENASADIAFTCKQGEVVAAEIDMDKKDACPNWIKFNEESMSVSTSDIGGKHSGKLALKVYVEGYNAPASVTVKVSAAKTAPKVKLQTAKISVPKFKSDMVNTIDLKLVSTDKKASFESYEINNIFVANQGDIMSLPEGKREAYKTSADYKLADYDSKTGELSLEPSGNAGEILSNGKILLIALVDGKTTQRLEFTVDVKVAEKVTIKPSAKSVPLDLAAGIGEDEAVVTIIPSAAGYDLGTFEDTFKVELKDASGKKDAAGELDVSFVKEENKVVFASNENTKAGSYKAVITDKDGATATVTVKASAALPKFKADKSSVTLNKLNEFDAETVRIKADKFANKDVTVTVTNSKGAEIAAAESPLTFDEPSIILPENGNANKYEEYIEIGNIRLTEKAAFGATYKIKVTFALADYENAAPKSVMITVKVPAEKKSAPSVKLKATGAVDPARIGSFVTETATFTNVTVSSLKAPTLTVTAKKGKKAATGEYIGENGDVSDWFVLDCNPDGKSYTISINTESECFANDGFDASLTFTCVLHFTGMNGDVSFDSSAFKLPVKEGKIKVSQSADKVSLCANDCFDRSYVTFRIDDTSVSDLRYVNIYTKNNALSNFEIKEIGNGIYRLGFTNSEVNPKIKTETIKLDMFFDGCANASKTTGVKVKVEILKAK